MKNLIAFKPSPRETAHAIGEAGFGTGVGIGLGIGLGLGLLGLIVAVIQSGKGR
jgi:hypothetical protein